jgi:hypothetical protein
MQGSPVKIQIPAHWNLIGRSLSAPLPVIAQQYSSATFVSLRFHSGKAKSGAHFTLVLPFLKVALSKIS